MVVMEIDIIIKYSGRHCGYNFGGGPIYHNVFSTQVDAWFSAVSVLCTLSDTK